MKSLHIYRKVSFYIIKRKNIILELEFSYLADMFYIVDILYMIDILYMSYHAGMYYQDDVLLYVCIHMYIYIFIIYVSRETFYI